MFTLNYLENNIKSTIEEIIDYNNITIKPNLGIDKGEVIVLILEQFDCGLYDRLLPVYNGEMFDVISGSDFDMFNDVRNDFSNCETAMDCIQVEALNIVNVAIGELVPELTYEIVTEMLS